MADFLELAGLQAIFWGLGFLGLFGITLLPWRSFQLVRRTFSSSRSSAIGRYCLVLLVIASALALTGAVACSYSMSRCLLGYHCNANRAGGWMFLGGIGFWYLAFELVASIILLSARKLGRVAI